MSPTTKERFMAKVRVTLFRHWKWTASKDGDGYGRFLLNGKARKAHRVAWLLFRDEPVPDEIDHVCRRRDCVNPEHLEAVSHQENIRRGSQAQQTHCKHGHEFTPQNTRRNKHGFRTCRTCDNQRSREWRARNRVK